MRISILGAGTWGIALAALLSKNSHEVSVWSALPAEIDELVANGRHKNLPNTELPKDISYFKEISEALSGAEMVVFVTPSSFIRSTARLAAPHLRDGMILVCAAKGIEPKTHKTMTEIINEEVSIASPSLKYEVAALSGPTHAEEVAIGLPTSIVAACKSEECANIIARVFFNSCMRVYTNTDVLGVEIAGALKNIIALAAGINRGMGFGDNSAAMLITRGIAEISRMGVAMGADIRTFSGLAGIGDLIVTCTSRHSRNNRCGELVGNGMSYKEAQEKIGMVVEGYHALEAAMELSEEYGVEMPITSAVNDVFKNGVSVKDAMNKLMNRDLKSEI